MGADALTRGSSAGTGATCTTGCAAGTLSAGGTTGAGIGGGGGIGVVYAVQARPSHQRCMFALLGSGYHAALGDTPMKSDTFKAPTVSVMGRAYVPSAQTLSPPFG